MQLDPGHERVVQELLSTRSVARTANALGLSEAEVQKIALIAFGLGRLEQALVDY